MTILFFAYKATSSIASNASTNVGDNYNWTTLFTLYQTSINKRILLTSCLEKGGLFN